MRRRDFLRTTALATVGTALTGFRTPVLKGYARIHHSGRHSSGLYAEHGAYRSDILSAYRILHDQPSPASVQQARTLPKPLVLTAQEALDHLPDWSAVGNAGWFEDYNLDSPSALYVEGGKLLKNINPHSGDGIVTIDSLTSGLAIHHKDDFHNHMTPAQASRYQAAVQATLLQYEGRDVIGSNPGGQLPRSGLAVGEKGIFYLVLKDHDQRGFLAEMNRVYEEFLGADNPSVVQFDSERSAQFVMEPSIGEPSYLRNMDPYVGSRRDNEIERPVANFIVFDRR